MTQITDKSNRSIRKTTHASSSLVSLRHHQSLWLVPTALLILALLPWLYGYYTLLRLVVSLVSALLAFTQWKHDDAVSGWTVALAVTALLYNPVITIHLTREIWSILNLATAALFISHLLALKRLLNT